MLEDSQIATFLRYGWLTLHECFTREAAEAMVADAYQQLGYRPDDPATWEKPLAFLFPSHVVPMREFAPRLWSAVCQLVGGEERLSNPGCGMGQWVINFWRGRDEPWEPPGPATRGWHIDGNFFRHFLDSPEQGLLVVPIFSDIGPRGGGTVFAADSVPVMARFLLDHPEGLTLKEMDFPGLVEQCRDFREITGKVGDAVLFHPLMLHSFAQNHSGRPRFITNINVGLKEPLDLSRSDIASYSPVERAILGGLGLERLAFSIRGKRERVEPA